MLLYRQINSSRRDEFKDSQGSGKDPRPQDPDFTELVISTGTAKNKKFRYETMDSVVLLNGGSISYSVIEKLFVDADLVR